MSKHDDLIIKIYKHPFWENKILNKTPNIKYDIEHILEFPIIKGEGSFKTIIGYIDYVIKVYEVKVNERRDKSHYETLKFICQINIEVKTTEEPLGDVIRQIKRYVEFLYVDDDIYDDGQRRVQGVRSFFLVGNCMEKYATVLKDQHITFIKEEVFEE